MHRYRSHTCAALRPSDVGSNVRLSGWVHRVRDHGGLLFIDLRDHYGLTQCVVDPDFGCFAAAEQVRSEWVIRVDGRVKGRTPETTNPGLPTGAVEVFIDSLEVLARPGNCRCRCSASRTIPRKSACATASLDLRRETLHANIVKRTKIISSIRRRMNDIGFAEYTTPILTASSPEGARDFLVPSRIHPGKFFALPQAPQQYKQLLMVAGFDRYFQIAPCFRDEDPRADRLPGEFYQLDLEMSFVTQEDVWETMQPVITNLFEEFADGKGGNARLAAHPLRHGDPQVRLGQTGPAQPDRDAGSDGAFRRLGLQGVRQPDRRRRQDRSLGDSGKDRRLARLLRPHQRLGAGRGPAGLAYIFWRKEGDALEGAGPVAKNIGPERTEAIRQQLGLGEGDAVFFVLGRPEKMYRFAGEARTKVGSELGLVDLNRFAFCWIVDFPFYEWSEERSARFCA